METNSGTGTESTGVGYSGHLVSNKKLSSVQITDGVEKVEIALEVREDVSEAAFRASRQEKRSLTLSRAKSGAARALRGLKFMSKTNVGNKGWADVETRFDQLAVNGLLPKSKFGKCIGMNESAEFVNKLFDALARRRGIKSSSVTKSELHEFWEQITDPNIDKRLQTFFDMVDKNADGQITEEEVKEMITLSAGANELSKIQERAEEYAQLFMQELDPDNLGYIEFDNFERRLLQGLAQSKNLKQVPDSRELSRMLSKKLALTKDKEYNPIKRWYKPVAYFVEDNWRQIWVMGLWLSICVGLFAWKFIQYKNRAVFDVMGYCVATAKGAAETLKFNMALILFPVCRNTLTWLRSSTRLGVLIPFDDNIIFHQVIAPGIAVGVGLHAVAHLACDFPRLLHATKKEYEPMKPFFGEKQPNSYWWFVKGTEGWTGLVMVGLMTMAFTLAQPWFRRNSPKLPKALKRLTGFNAFWYSHHLFVVVYVLLVVHGWYIYLSKKWYKKTTWMYLAVPLILYACERLIRAFRSGYEKVKILKVAVYPGKPDRSGKSKNVLALRMSKPQEFEYTSGEYIYLKCSAVSPFEWHPFSLTSAPGDDYLSVHICTLGDWTSRLASIFSNVCQRDNSGILKADIEQSKGGSSMPKLQIDGPYGAPAQDYKEYEVILLVGLGIGATPLISIVKDVLYNIKQYKEINAKDHGTYNNNMINKKINRPFATKRAYFYWATREEGSFEWFRDVMNVVANNDIDGVIELHNHCTSVFEEGDARSAFITVLQSLNYAKNGVDILSGTKVKTCFARPKWRSVFKHVADKHANQRVGVFYCGEPRLVGELKNLSREFSLETSTEFVFHKENF